MRATKETTAGRKYLDLQREARRTGRPTDELIQLYASDARPLRPSPICCFQQILVNFGSVGPTIEPPPYLID